MHTSLMKPQLKSCEDVIPGSINEHKLKSLMITNVLLVELICLIKCKKFYLPEHDPRSIKGHKAPRMPNKKKRSWNSSSLV